MKNKEVNPKLKEYKKYRNLQRGFTAASWVSVLLPDGILLGVNRNEWVKSKEDAISVSFALVITVLVSLFVAYKKAKDQLQMNKLGTVVALWLAVGVIYLLSSLLTELLLIVVCAAIGLTTSVFLDIPSEYYKNLKIQAGKDLEEVKKTNEIFEASKRAFGIGEGKGKND